MVGWLEAWGPYGAGGLGIGAGIWLAKLVGQGITWTITYFTGRLDKKEAQIDADMRELVDQLKQQIKELRDECAALKAESAEFRVRLNNAESELLECKKLHADAEARAARLEATEQGLGDARAAAHLIIAAEKDAAKKRD